MAMSEPEPRTAATMMESPPQAVVVAFDAARDHDEDQIKIALKRCSCAGTYSAAATLCSCSACSTPSPIQGTYQNKACANCFVGRTSFRCPEEQVSKTADLYEARLRRSAGQLRRVGVSVTLQIAAGTPAKMVMLQEVSSSKAAWVILDRHFRRDFEFYEKHIACKVAIFQDNLSVRIVKSFYTNPSQLPSKGAAQVQPVYTATRTFDPNLEMSVEEGRMPIMPPAASYFVSLCAGMPSSTPSLGVESPNLAHSDQTESMSNGKFSKGENDSIPRENTVDSPEKPVSCVGCKQILKVEEKPLYPVITSFQPNSNMSEAASSSPN